MIDLEIALTRSLGWSLWEIEETDVESLLGFVNRLTETCSPAAVQGKTPSVIRSQGPRKTYCDRVDWL